jgi:hypothetical protein
MRTANVYAELAEKICAEAIKVQDGETPQRANKIALAQVYATLAVAAASRQPGNQ